MARAKSADTFRQGAVPTVWARTTAQLLVAAQALGMPRAHLIEAARLDASALEDPDARVPLDALYTLIEHIGALAQNELVHMTLAAMMKPEALDALAFVVMTSPTYGDGLRAMIRYQRVWSDAERYDLEEDATTATLVYTPHGAPRRAHAMMAEMFAVDMLVHGPAVTGEPFDETRVRFTHTAPRDRLTHKTLLAGIEAEFERPRNELVLPVHYLARRVAQEGRESIFAFFEQHLEARLPTAGEDGIAREGVTARARAALLRSPERAHTMPMLAAALKTSARTLQRRLLEEGTSLRALSAETRRARAIALITSGQSIAEVAYLLGYSEPSAFHRAFRRWTGRTPESYRRAAHERGG